MDWNVEQKTEPPLTMSLSDDIIISALDAPLILKNYPNHTQAVERMVPVVTESCAQKVGYTGRHRYLLSCFFIYRAVIIYDNFDFRWILSTLTSRKLCPKFDTKKDDM